MEQNISLPTVVTLLLGSHMPPSLSGGLDSSQGYSSLGSALRSENSLPRFLPLLLEIQLNDFLKSRSYTRYRYPGRSQLKAPCRNEASSDVSLFILTLPRNVDKKEFCEIHLSLSMLTL